MHLAAVHYTPLPRVPAIRKSLTRYGRSVTAPHEDPEFDQRVPVSITERSYGRKLQKTRKPFRVWIREPGSWLVLIVLSGFFLLVWGACVFSAIMLGHVLGATSMAQVFGLSLGMLLLIVFSWASFYVGPKILVDDGGFLDRLFSGFLRKPGTAPELDTSPALLARKRGDHQSALRFYRQWLREFPHRLELRFHIAEVEHHDANQPDAALRGYKDFLRRVRSLEREATPEESEFVPLAKAYIADLERVEPDPPARRVIKV